MCTALGSPVRHDHVACGVHLEFAAIGCDNGRRNDHVARTGDRCADHEPCAGPDVGLDNVGPGDDNLDHYNDNDDSAGHDVTGRHHDDDDRGTDHGATADDSATPAADEGAC